MSKNVHKTPGKKGSKNEEREFQQILKTLEKDKQALIAPQSQITMFYGAGIGVSTIPIALHVADASSFFSYILYFIIGVTGSAFFLFMSYNLVANKNRRQLYISRSRESSTEDESFYLALVQHINMQSGSYALFTVNLCFLVGFLLFALSILRPYSIPAHFHFIASTTIPSAITYGLARFF